MQAWLKLICSRMNNGSNHNSKKRKIGEVSKDEDLDILTG
jgi:hypothetical protein